MNIIEVVIIGGGISGLYTAFKLQQANISYLLLEAKPVFGGRIEGLPTIHNSELTVDLGPTWFWPHQKKIKQLLTRLELEWFEQFSKGDILYHADPAEKPTRTYNPGAMNSFRVAGGMQKLISALTGQLGQTNLKTEHCATAAHKDENRWLISALHQSQEYTFEAKQLILALPPRLILKYLTPDKYLSGDLIKALQSQQTWMSGQAKFVALYNKPFWRENGLAGQAFSRVGPMVEIHDGSSAEDSGFALFGFIGLPPSIRLQFTAEQLKDQCIKQLGDLFGPGALDVKASYLKDWSQDRWVATEQDIVESPRHAEFDLEQYRNELELLRLHLVASEFAQSEAGYLEGALSAADLALHTFKI
jgi:monoamine oxidase